MREDRPQIFGYIDFRKYLSDFQKWKQEEDKGFNKSNLSKLLGLPNTRSYFTDVLNGRVVSPAFIERFANVFGLDKDESRYFMALVKFNQADNSDERELYFDQLVSLNRTPKNVLDKECFQYYRDLHNSTIRAILNFIDFNDDYNALAKKVFPPITGKQAKDSVSLLLRLGLLNLDSKGFLRPTDKSISTPDYTKDEIIKNFQIQSVELAKWCILKNQNVRQIIATNVISISDTGYKRLEKKIEKFRSEVRALVHKDEDPADKVYHLDILLFPNSK